MWTLYQSIMVKREQNIKAKLSIYRSIYVPNLTYSHKLWVVTERIRFWIQTMEMEEFSHSRVAQSSAATQKKPIEVIQIFEHPGDQDASLVPHR